MTDYFHLLNDTQKANMNVIIQKLAHSVVTSDFTKAAILAVVSKETSFLLHNEASYRNTPNDRIRAVFGVHFKGISDEALTAIKNDDTTFFNDIYGGLYGNAPDEGYKYRGRGFNQITFKGNYDKVGHEIGADLVANPDLLSRPDIAAKALIQYFLRRFAILGTDKHLQDDLHATDINSFENIEDALVAVYRANAGWGKAIFPDTTGGFAKAHERVQGFYDIVTGKTKLA